MKFCDMNDLITESKKTKKEKKDAPKEFPFFKKEAPEDKSPDKDGKEEPKDDKKEAVAYPTFTEWMKLKETTTSTACVAGFARPVGIGTPGPDDDKKKKNEKGSVIRRNFP